MNDEEVAEVIPVEAAVSVKVFADVIRRLEKVIVPAEVLLVIVPENDPVGVSDSVIEYTPIVLSC